MSYPRMKSCPPEWIVLCIDACDDRPPRFSCGQQGGKQQSTLVTIKKCVEAFILNKAAMNSEHQFAILAYKANTTYVSNWSNKVPDLLKQVQNITPNPLPEQPTPVSRIFDTVYEKVLKNGEEDNPLRIVMFYGRSGTCIMGDNVLLNNKNVLVDIIYIHRPVLSAKENKRVISNYSELRTCLSEKSLCFASVCDSLLALKYTMMILMHPNLRLRNIDVQNID